MIPRSEKLTIIDTETINSIVFNSGRISIISMLFIILSGIVTFIYRKNKIVKAASWRLNLITCIGCILAYISVIIYGIEPNDFLCNARESLVIISFTLVFMPLFAKTYRISAIFNGMLQMKREKSRINN